MPIHVRISHHDRLVVCVAHGTITTEDIQNAVKDFVGSGAVHYRKLVDVAAANSSDADLDRVKAILNFIRATPNAAERGPVAFVVDANRGELVREFAELTEEGERPLKVFTRLSEARQWLDEIGQIRMKR
jgi:hypothetical protein